MDTGEDFNDNGKLDFGDYRIQNNQTTGTVRIAPGEIQANIIVSPVDDKLVEDLDLEVLGVETGNNEAQLKLGVITEGLRGKYYRILEKEDNKFIDRNEGSGESSFEVSTQPLLIRNDYKIDFDWVLGSPDAKVGDDQFKVVWEGTITTEVAGTYQFHTKSDDGVKLWVSEEPITNQQPIIDKWLDGAITEYSSDPISLNANTRYYVKLEYYENVGPAAVQLLWTPPGGTKEIIPSSQFSSLPEIVELPTGSKIQFDNNIEATVLGYENGELTVEFNTNDINQIQVGDLAKFSSETVTVELLPDTNTTNPTYTLGGEDVNLNGKLDSGEDSDSDGKIDSDTAQATLSIQDDDVPGIRIVEIGNHTVVREGEGETATFEVSLLSEPVDDVTITLTPGAEIEFVNPINPKNVSVDKDVYSFGTTSDLDVQLESLVFTDKGDTVAFKVKPKSKPTGNTTVVFDDGNDGNDNDNTQSVSVAFSDEETNPVTGEVTAGNWNEFQQIVLYNLDKLDTNYKISAVINGTTIEIPITHTIETVQKQTTTITIKPEDWYKLQTVTISGSNDDVTEPGIYHADSIQYTVTSSADKTYNGIFVPDQTIHVVDRVIDAKETATTLGQGFKILKDSMDNLSLPLIGSLDGVAPDPIGDFSQDLVNTISSTDNLTASKLKEIIENVLGEVGLDAFTVTTEVAKNEISVLLDISKNYELFKLPLSTDLGIPALGIGFETEGDLQSNFNYNFSLGFGLHDDFGFYIDTDTTSFKTDVTVDLDQFSGQGSLGFLKLDFADDPDNPTKLSVSFEAGLNDLDNYKGIQFFDVDGDGQLDANEPFTNINDKGIVETELKPDSGDYDIDTNENGSYDEESFIKGEGIYRQTTGNESKYYFDVNRNGTLDSGELYTTESSKFNKEFKLAKKIVVQEESSEFEYYYDANENGKVDSGETKVDKKLDKNNNLTLDGDKSIEGEGKFVQGTGIAFLEDQNSNGKFDSGEKYVNSDNNVFTKTDVSDGITFAYYDFNNNNKYDTGDSKVSDNPNIVKLLDDGDRLTINELNNFQDDPELGFSDLFNYQFAGEANLGLKAKTSINNDTNFPAVSVDLAANLPLFNYGNQDEAGSNGLSVEFNDITLDLGGFITNVIKPVFDIVDEIISPIKPVIQVLNADTKIFGYIGLESAFDQDGKPGVSLLEIAKTLNTGDDEQAKKIDKAIKFADTVTQIVEIVDLLKNSADNIEINFGSYSLDDFKAASKDEADEIATVKPGSTGGQNSAKTTDNLKSDSNIESQATNSANGTLISKLKSLDGFAFPILTSPTTAVKLLFGESGVDLVTYDIPDFAFEFKMEQSFPIFPPLGINGILEGSFSAKTDLAVGYDTYGIEQWLESDFSLEEAYKVLDGFYLNDWDANGNDKDEFSMQARIAAGAGVDVALLSAFLKGGLEGNVGFDLEDVGEKNRTSDGKVRGSEIISRLDTPLELFELHGDLSVFLNALVKVWAFGWHTVYEQDFARFKIAEFSIGANGISGSSASGPQMGSLVYWDANFNEQFDSSEPFTFTDSNGNYNLEIPPEYDLNLNGEFDNDEGQIVVEGGIDTITGLAAKTQLIATASSTMVTPLTTLKSTLIQQGLTAEEANNLIKIIFDLSSDVNIDNYNPYEAIGKNDPKGVKIATDHIKVMNVLLNGISFLENAGYQPEDSETQVIIALKDVYQTVNDFNFSDSDDLKLLLIKLNEKLENSTVSEETLAGITKLVANSNGLVEDIIEQALERSVSDVLPSIAPIKKAVYSSVPSLTKQLVKGEITNQEAQIELDKLLNGNSFLVQYQSLNANLTVKVISNDTLSEGEAGNGQFIIELGEAAPSQGLKILYTLSGTATLGQDFSFEGSNFGEINIQGGESQAILNLSVIDDTLKEIKETITLNLKYIGGGYLIDPLAQTALITINDNDQDNGDDSQTGLDLSGSFGDDALSGDLANDSLQGSYGDDLIQGFEGNDYIQGGSGEDTIDGGGGHDIIQGGFGDDFLMGGSGDDNIDGGSGDDKIEGGVGYDLLSGGFVQGTTSFDNLAKLLNAEGVQFKAEFFDTLEEVLTAYDRGKIDGLSVDRGVIVDQISHLSNPANHRLLNVELSSEPIALVIPENDSQWADIVRWVTYVPMQAEEFGINSENIEQILAINSDNTPNNDSNIAIRRFLGIEGDLGTTLGLPNDFAVNIIKQVGNYQEIYESYFPDIDREKNLLYTDGGTLYSPPFSGTVAELELIDNNDRNLIEEIKNRGLLKVGTNGETPGFSTIDLDGNAVGFDIDLGKALAAAIFKDAQAIEFIPQNNVERFTNVANGIVDVTAHQTTHNLVRDAQYGVDYSHIYMYTGAGVLVRKDSGILNLAMLNGRKVGFTEGTTTIQNLQDKIADFSGTFIPQFYGTEREMFEAYEAGEVDAISNDLPLLTSTVKTFADPENHRILNESISKEPLALVVDENQSEWADVVRSVTNILLEAEEYGITQDNIEQLVSANTDNDSSNDSNTAIRQFLGIEGSLGESLGLANDFAVNVIKAVGNYGEIYQRHFDIKLQQRGLNALSNDFGLQLPFPQGGSVTTEVEIPHEVSGTPGRDNLTGTDGQDIITGFQGRDTVTGGDGADIFVYTSIIDGGDVITDFEVGSDLIDLVGVLDGVGFKGFDPIAEGYVGFRSRGADTIVTIDPNGAKLPGRARPFVLVETVDAAELNNPGNFIFDDLPVI